MNLRQRLIFSASLSIFLILILLGTSLAVQQYNKNLHESQELINATTNQLITLQFVTTHYLTFFNERSLNQWEIQYKKIAEAISSDQQINNEIGSHFTHIQESFSIFLTLKEKEDSTNSDPNLQRLLHHSSSDLQIAFQDCFSLLNTLTKDIQADIDRFQRRSNYAFSIIVILTLIIFIYQTRDNIFTIYRPLDALQKGVNAIQHENYDYQIPVNASGRLINTKNELGQLALAFNQMAGQLNITLKDLRDSINSGNEREQLLTEILNSNPNMVYLFTEEGNVEMANLAMAHYFGLDLSELIGANLKSLADAGVITQALFERITETNHSVINTQTPTVIPNGRLTHVDGTTTWFHTLLTPFIQSGQSTKVLGTSTNITEQKINEERIQSINKTLETRVEDRTTDLRRANEELSAFAYSISHDLRAPLRAIDGFSRILQDEHSEELSPPAVRYIKLLRENAVMMGKLIEGLLEFSRKGRQALKLRMVTPINIVTDVLQDMKYEYPEHSVEIKIGELPDCFADPLLLKQVYRNLISNAFKFSENKESPVVEIGSEIKDNETIYFIKDNGVGFDMQYADRLFGVFQRLHRMDEFKGTGVGLAIVQRIIHRHGGDIWVQAAIDQGTTFYFTL